MTYVYLVLNWTFGYLLSLTGFILMFVIPFAGIPMLACGLLLFPPVRDLVYSKINKKLPFIARFEIIFLLFMTFNFLYKHDLEQKTQEIEAKRVEVQLRAEKIAEKITAIEQQKREQAEEAHQKVLEYFNQNSVQIIGQIQEAIAKKDFTNAIALSEKYLETQNPELLALNAKAKTDLDAAERATKTKELLGELNKVHRKELEKSLSLYSQLAKLNPDVPAYAKKEKYFSDKIIDQNETIRLAEIKKQKR